MKTLLYANRAEPKSISVISILLLAAVGAITKLRCMHRECYIFASQNLCCKYTYSVIYPRYGHAPFPIRVYSCAPPPLVFPIGYTHPSLFPPTSLPTLTHSFLQ